jgi:hypothetical protein
MLVRGKAIVAILATGAVAAGGAAAYAATNHASTNHDPQPLSRFGHGYGNGYGGPGGMMGGGMMGQAMPAGVRDVIGQIRTAVLAQAPGIVDPILDQAVTAGRLTAAQAATAKQALADLKAGNRPSPDVLGLLRDDQARTVLGEALQAVAKQAPGIAAPILSDAVSKGTIDQATADRISQRIQAIADRAAKGRLPFGPPAGMRGAPFGPGGSGHGPFGHTAPSTKTAGVLESIAKAVAQQAPTVARPIIEHAAAAGTITSAQADELKSAASDLASGGRAALLAHRDLLADRDVRDVIRDVVKALATQAPSIAKPIIDKAVSDGTLTQAQADELTQHIADAAKRAGG